MRKTMSKERPILFSGPMVRSILDGSKTETRRVIKPDWWRCLDPEDTDDRKQALRTCPYGEPGDRLWVRETWAADQMFDLWKPSLIQPKDSEGVDRFIWYAADTRPTDYSEGKNRPSIFMPRWASRLTLDVLDVRVERLRDITAGGALAEGMSAPGARLEFCELWDTLTHDVATSWAANPFVWVVSFKVSDQARTQAEPAR